MISRIPKETQLLQGELVKENKPNRVQYFTTRLCDDGPPSKIECEIMMDPDSYNKGAPLTNDGKCWGSLPNHRR